MIPTHTLSYTEILHRLFDEKRCKGVKLGLDTVRRLAAALHLPSTSVPMIHVAGSNGKGSVSTKIAAILSQGGYRVGLFTSPHLFSYRERIKIDGQLITEEAITTRVNTVFAVMDKEGIQATFFELTTLLALLTFAEEEVDFAVIEVGLGGRLDATNVITPILSVITSISLEHTHILGETVEAIAKEKGGIIKEKCPVVFGARTPKKVLQQIAKERKSPCFFAAHGDDFDEENQQTARKAIEVLLSTHSVVLTPHCVEVGIQARPPCRFEVADLEIDSRHKSTVVFDVAHNPDGLQHLFDKVKQQFPGASQHILYGLSDGKDNRACSAVVAKGAASITLVAVDHERILPAAALAETFPDTALHLLQPLAALDKSVENALNQLRSDPNGVLIVCGSFFILSEVRRALGFKDVYDQYDMNESSFVDKKNT